ncbi:hypothetical protein AHF37_12695 [Paragonimus kellicotti]|nr:hypothetical protein AHF37_12695 [Paragonimus kellicotti]
MSPHPTEPYEHLKSALLKRTTASEQKRLEALISGEELGDRKPSQLLRRLQQILDGRSIDEALFRQLFLQRLPNFVRSILASRGHMLLDELAELADDIMSIPNNSHISALAPTSPDTVTQILLQQIEMLNSNLEKLQLSQRPRSRNHDRKPRSPSTSAHQSSSRNRNRPPRSPSTSAYRPDSHNKNFCWYHFKFGADARKCSPPCQFKSQNFGGKLRSQPVMTTTALGTGSPSRRLFVRDSASNYIFLVDSGAEISVIPSSPKDKTRVNKNFVLTAANNTTINTYGQRSLTLNLGLRRPFTWVFTVADVPKAIYWCRFSVTLQLAAGS